MADPPAVLCEGRYKTLHLLGKGAFSQVWKAQDTSDGSFVAVKFEDYEDEQQALQLEDEARLLQSICKPSHPLGFPHVFAFGDVGHFCYMVSDLLGPSLGDLLAGSAAGHFEAPVVASLAVQMLSRLAYLHSKGILHRDIKPENFLIGLGTKAHLLHLVDFGLSAPFERQGSHIPFREGVSLKGTIRYASVNALRRRESGRKDDLESLGYVLVMLAKGQLPWTGLSAANEAELAQAVLAAKDTTKTKDLCQGLPGAFPTFLEAARTLGFSETPDYNALTAKFRKMVAGDLERATAYPWLPSQHRRQKTLAEAEAEESQRQRDIEHWDPPPQLELDFANRRSQKWNICSFQPLFAPCMSMSMSMSRPSDVDSDEDAIDFSSHSSVSFSTSDSKSESTAA